MLGNKWSGRALCVAVVAGSLTACDFIQPVDSNPNAVPSATLDQLLVGVEVSQFFVEESQSSRLVSVWLQQMTGTDRQFVGFGQYSTVEGDDDDAMNALYDAGGIVANREGVRQAGIAGRPGYAGIFKVWEALAVGMVASEFGGIPYSEAISPDVAQPKLDTQAEVYTAVLALLDEAIADLQQGGLGPGAADFVYGGDFARWIAAAHTLKARLHLHWAESDPARYNAALTEAQQGIQDASGDWLALHSSASTENQMWYQFVRDRGDYISSAKFLVDLMRFRPEYAAAGGDPRMPYYFSSGTGNFADTIIGSQVGNPPGDPSNDASELACGPNVDAGCQGWGWGAPDFSFPIMTCAENNFIIAEAQSVAGNDAAARTALDDALACAEDRFANFGATIDLSAYMSTNDALSGTDLFNEIMDQKYMALFLNRNVWSDYKRTCRPTITPFDYPNQVVPGRFLYSQAERQTNENIPEPDAQPDRNDNDPAACP
jgi:hypothetical protein